MTDALAEMFFKKASFSCGNEQEKAFIKSRDSLKEESFLIHPDPSIPFYLAKDASDVGMGTVLLQKRNGTQTDSVCQQKIPSFSEKECVALDRLSSNDFGN